MFKALQLKSGLRGLKSAMFGAAMVAVVGVTAPKPAQALTFMINFTPAASTDIWNVTTTPETFASWGFQSLPTLAAIQAMTLTYVNADYLAYPNVAQNPLSTLPVGKELNINFEISVGLTLPTNGDAEYYYINVGDANPNQSFLGQACLGCVRNSAGQSTRPVGSIVGSVLTDSIWSGLGSLASTDAHRMNLLAGTLAHEIGHTLTLPHPTTGPAANPGQSIYSIMATGAAPTSMPNNQRILDRAFAYTEFTQIIGTVGLRDVSPIPEPSTYGLMALGLAALGLRVRRARQAA